MTGKQLRDIRGRMGLTQGQLGYRLRTTGNTIARWERNEVAISEPVALLIEYVAKEAGVDIALDAARGRRNAQGKRAHAKAPKAPTG